MAQSDVHGVSDAAPSTTIPDSATNARVDAGFSHVGDNSSNVAWSKMTGGNVGASDNSLQGAGSGNAAGSGDNSSIDFSKHGDIYAQAGSSSHSGLASVSDAHNYDSSAGSGLSAAAGAADYSSQLPLEGQAKPDTTTDNVAAPRAGESVPFDGKTATYDGNQFYELSQTDKAQLPNETIDKVNSNNYTNLQNRVEALGDKMPDVVMRGVGDAGVHDMEVLAGNKAGEYSAARGGSNYFAVSTQPPTDAKDTIDHLGSHFSRAQGYGNMAAGPEGGRVYAFAHNDLGSEYKRPSWTELVAQPFSETPASGESRMNFDASKMSHIATLSGEDVAEINHASIIRQDTARSYQNLRSLHKVISAIEEGRDNY
ncbi:MAG: hypothetical protein JSS83_04520 [Cyanobacteria bacterium SZAS LIN-3]|nr:hypothetical protein [Cyanobacteria bacterium SZAS LIN-3]